MKIILTHVERCFWVGQTLLRISFWWHYIYDDDVFPFLLRSGNILWYMPSVFRIALPFLFIALSQYLKWSSWAQVSFLMMPPPPFILAMSMLLFCAYSIILAWIFWFLFWHNTSCLVHMVLWCSNGSCLGSKGSHLVILIMILFQDSLQVWS